MAFLDDCEKDRDTRIYQALNDPKQLDDAIHTSADNQLVMVYIQRIVVNWDYYIRRGGGNLTDLFKDVGDLTTTVLQVIEDYTDPPPEDNG